MIHWLNAAAGFDRQIDQLTSFNCIRYNQDTPSGHFTGVKNPEAGVCKVEWTPAVMSRAQGLSHTGSVSRPLSSSAPRKAQPPSPLCTSAVLDSQQARGWLRGSGYLALERVLGAVTRGGVKMLQNSVEASMEILSYSVYSLPTACPSSPPHPSIPPQAHCVLPLLM